MKLSTLLKSACAKINDFQNIKVEPKSKYGNKKVVVDGIAFDSRKESRMYIKLKRLQLAGEIQNLELQVHYELNPNGAFSYKYVADFKFIDKRTGITTVMDVKGFKTREYKKKKRL